MALSLMAGCASVVAGTAHAFFEGWWEPSLLENLKMTAGRLLPALATVVFAFIAIGRPSIGGLLHILVGCLIFILPFVIDAGFLPDPNHPSIPYLLLIHVTGILLAIIGLAYLKGRPQPRWLAMGLVAGMPVVMFLICAVEPLWRINHRRDDGSTAARRVKGNGVELVWAPAGPGWPQQGGQKFDETEKMVARLTEDGLSLSDFPQNVWRMPTADEVVRSLTRDGQKCRRRIGFGVGSCQVPDCTRQGIPTVACPFAGGLLVDFIPRPRKIGWTRDLHHILSWWTI